MGHRGRNAALVKERIRLLPHEPTMPFKQAATPSALTG
jgi:hypothetical protein